MTKADERTVFDHVMKHGLLRAIYRFDTAPSPHTVSNKTTGVNRLYMRLSPGPSSHNQQGGS